MTTATDLYDEPEDDDAIYGPPISTPEYIRCEHVAQIRVSNAGRGVMHIKELVDARILPQASLDAAEAEVEAAREALGMVHATPLGEVPSDDTYRVVGIGR
jgi:hypothetical protein